MNERLSRVIVRNARNANAFAHLCDLTPKMLAKGDLPMSRVKFGTKHEYEYLGNYKVLQNCFTSLKIDKVFLYIFHPNLISGLSKSSLRNTSTQQETTKHSRFLVPHAFRHHLFSLGNPD